MRAPCPAVAAPQCQRAGATPPRPRAPRRSHDPTRVTAAGRRERQRQRPRGWPGPALRPSGPLAGGRGSRGSWCGGEAGCCCCCCCCWVPGAESASCRRSLGCIGQRAAHGGKAQPHNRHNSVSHRIAWRRLQPLPYVHAVLSTSKAAMPTRRLRPRALPKATVARSHQGPWSHPALRCGGFPCVPEGRCTDRAECSAGAGAAQRKVQRCVSPMGTQVEPGRAVEEAPGCN